jgi:hypothetical protein
MGRRRPPIWGIFKRDRDELLSELGIDLDPEREIISWGAAAFTVLTYIDEEFVPYGGGQYLIPRRFFFSWRESDWEKNTFEDAPALTLRLEVEHGVLVCTAVLVHRLPGEPPLTATRLRKTALARMIEAAGSRAALKKDGSGIGFAILRDKQGWLEAYRSEAHKPRRGQRLEDEHLAKVAEIYRDALATGRPPTQTVAEVMHTARPNAGRWVAEARRRGLLAQAPGPGRAGERRQTRRRRTK